MSQRQVTVTAVDLTQGTVSATERTTGHTAIYPLLPIRTGVLPQVGQTWLLDRSMGGGWSFAALLGGPRRAVTGTRAGTNALTLSMLAALVELGLVDDQTV